MKLQIMMLVASTSLLLQSASLIAAPESLGPLSQFVTPDDDGTWLVQDDGHSAYIENSQSQGSIIYYYVNPEQGAEGSRTISVDIAFGSSSPQSLAGLLYGFHENPKSYFAYAVGGDRSISIHQMLDGDFSEIDRVSIDSLSAEKTTLKIAEKGTQITISVNDQVLTSYTDDQLGKGAVGIFASDVGQYKFSNFSSTWAKTNNTATTLNQTNTPQVETNEDTPPPATNNEQTSASTNTASSATKDKEPVKYFPSTDSRFNGMISSYTPFPASWKQLPGHPEFFYEGPNSIKISNTFGKLFQFSNNPDGLQMLQQMGQQNVPPKSIENIVSEFFMPHAEKEKRTLVKTYPLPEYAQRMANFRARLFKSVPTRESSEAYGLEWVDDKGLSYITALNIATSEAFPISSWYTQGQYLVAETAHFEDARDAFLYGLTHTEINPKWLQTANQKDAQRAGQSWAAHQSRMDAIKARGNASRSVADIYSEISDISHAGYLKRSAIQSHGHSASVRAVSDQSLIANHSTGEHYVVDGLENHHWVNSNGVHIATDNALFDPRTDKTLNMFDWTQFQKE